MFENKNVLVIGGSSGIGLKVLKQLHEKGCKGLYTASRTKLALFDEMDVVYQPFDAANEFDASFLPTDLHALVYCPGTITLKPFHRLKEADFQKDWEVNVLGAVKVIQGSLKALKNTKQSSIVLFSTVASQVGMGFHASIATAKAALEGLGKSLAAEYVAAGIRVNIIAPSLTDTPLAANLLSTPEKRAASAKRHPIGRVGTVEDLSEAVLYLISNQSAWMTGQILRLDGGLSSLKLF